MTVLRAQCSFGADSEFPRDRFVITPHFNLTGAIELAQGIADDLADALVTWCAPTGARHITVKTYDAQGTPPVFPNGEAVRNAASFPVSTFPRELSVCLSYFADQNVKRKRGRLYVPVQMLFTGTTLGIRPVDVLRDKAAELVPIFAGLGGVDVDWVVWSRLDQVARKVSDWWVDDEWDIQRSRGLRPTARTSGTTSG